MRPILFSRIVVRIWVGVVLVLPVASEAVAQPLTIRLDQFLQLAQIAGTGGQAKQLIQQGNVSVNGEIETRRRRQLRVGDQVAVGDELLEVELES